MQFNAKKQIFNRGRLFCAQFLFDKLCERYITNPKVSHNWLQLMYQIAKLNKISLIQ